MKQRSDGTNVTTTVKMMTIIMIEIIIIIIIIIIGRGEVFTGFWLGGPKARDHW